jgi:peptide/nickel transport system permease protein
VAKYLLKRLAALVVVVFLVSFGVFFLIHLLPGNPVNTILGPNVTPANKAAVLHQLGLNKPLYEQYFIWIGHVLQGNLGQSYITHNSVSSIVKNAFIIDIQLIVLSQLMAFAVAIPLALLAARRPNKSFDRISTAATFGMLAMPPFVIAPLLLVLLAIHTHWFPGPASYTVGGSFATNFHALILPSIILAVGSIVIYYRILRNDLIATLQEEFITMARSKGLSDRRVLLKHALRPSSLSLLATAGLNISTLLGGAFVVEALFQLPGIGYYLVTSILQRDYIAVQGLVLIVAVVILIVNFTVDTLYSVVDPRVARN